MKKWIIKICLFALPSILHGQSSYISGVVNKYSKVTSINYTNYSLTLQNSSNYKPGDICVIIQMKGAGIDSSNTSSFGSVSNCNSAGNFEYVYIQSVCGSNVYLNKSLTNTYDVNSAVQLVKAGVYQNALLIGDITCTPWNTTSETGGVVFLVVWNTLTLNANITANGGGFTGGQIAASFTSSTSLYYGYYYDPSAGQGGGKGESYAYISQSKNSGRGAIASGGGGGNFVNFGAGGGSNYGIGGTGNNGNNPSSTNVGGIGGYSNSGVLSSYNKIFMGGGGGAGQQNDYAGSAGGNGGGIIIIKAATITNNSKKILSNGYYAASAYNDGAGGGGGGGSVIIDLSSSGSTNSLTVEAYGGNGGDNTYGGYTNHGVGAGGGGGVIWINNPPSSYTPNYSGGDAGYATNPLCLSYNTHAGATNGDIGSGCTGSSGSIDIDTISRNPYLASVNAGPDQTICKGVSAQLYATSTSSGTYLWSPNSNVSNINISNPKVSPIVTTKYIVSLSTSNGCVTKDTIQVNVININLSVSPDKTICKGDSLQLSASSDSSGTYLWSPNNNISNKNIFNPKVAPPTSTKYFVALTSNSCTVKDSVQINVINVSVNAGPDLTICKGDSIQINPSSSFATKFSWTPKAGLSDSTIANPYTKTTANTQYILTASNGNCFSKDTVNISVVQCNSCSNCNTTNAINNGLVACYPFNGNTNDESGNGNNGSPSAISYTYDRFSEIIASGDFSNSSSKVDVSPSIFPFHLNTYSYSVWVKLNSIPASEQLYSILSIGSDKADQFLMASNITGQIGFGYGSYFANLTTPDRYWSSSLPSLATWYHIALTRSSTSLNFYINGTLVDSRSTSSSAAAYGSPIQAIIGARIGSPTIQHFDGNIDDLRIYNRDLSSTEIQSLYNLSTDRMHANAGPDLYSCKKDFIQLNGTGTGNFFTWSPIKFINNNIVSNPIINPDTNITYVLSVSNGTCIAFDTMKVFVTSIDANIYNKDTSICLGDTVKFTTFINGDSYTWIPKIFINDTTSKKPFVFPDTTTKYFLTVTRGTCVKQDSVTINVVKNILADAGSDQQICKGNSVQLSAYGPTGSVFSWLPNYALTDNSISNPIAKPLVDTSYFLKVHLGKNCVGYDTVKIKVNPNPTVDAGLDKDICREPFIIIGVSSTLADSFYWSPPTGLSNINVLQTQVSPTTNTTYFIKAINKITGCFNFDTVNVSLIKPTASFNSDLQSGQLPLNVHFTN